MQYTIRNHEVGGSVLSFSAENKEVTGLEFVAPFYLHTTPVHEFSNL